MRAQVADCSPLNSKSNRSAPKGKPMPLKILKWHLGKWNRTSFSTFPERNHLGTEHTWSSTARKFFQSEGKSTYHRWMLSHTWTRVHICRLCANPTTRENNSRIGVLYLKQTRNNYIRVCIMIRCVSQTNKKQLHSFSSARSKKKSISKKIIFFSRRNFERSAFCSSSNCLAYGLMDSSMVQTPDQKQLVAHSSPSCPWNYDSNIWFQ